MQLNDIQNEVLLNDGRHIDGEWIIGKKIYAYIELVENEYKIISSDQIW